VKLAFFYVLRSIHIPKTFQKCLSHCKLESSSISIIPPVTPTWHSLVVQENNSFRTFKHDFLLALADRARAQYSFLLSHRRMSQQELLTKEVVGFYGEEIFRYLEERETAFKPRFRQLFPISR